MRNLIFKFFKQKEHKDIEFAIAYYYKGKYHYEKSLAGLSKEDVINFINKYGN